MQPTIQWKTSANVSGTANNVDTEQHCEHYWHITKYNNQEKYHHTKILSPLSTLVNDGTDDKTSQEPGNSYLAESAEAYQQFSSIASP